MKKSERKEESRRVEEGRKSRRARVREKEKSTAGEEMRGYEEGDIEERWVDENMEVMSGMDRGCT